MIFVKNITMPELATGLGRNDRSHGWSLATIYRVQKQGRFYYALVRTGEKDADLSTQTKLTPLQASRLGLTEETK